MYIVGFVKNQLIINMSYRNLKWVNSEWGHTMVQAAHRPGELVKLNFEFWIIFND